MKEYFFRFTKLFSVQLALYIFVNGLFIFKYISRAGINPYYIIVIYSFLILALTFFYYRFSSKISEKIFKISYFSLLSIMVLAIMGFLISIEPYSIQVDRWSALSYFWDYFFQGKYPYSAHTHISLTNFPSPFPFWHGVNLVFYLLGDVGIGLIFFLLLTAYVIKYFFETYRKSFFFILLLFTSSAYWWEVAVRSDALSNAILVFVLILWINKKNLTLSSNLILISAFCGLIASTRLSAIMPLALYFFKPYLQLPSKQKLIFPVLVLGITLFTFLPFIFWDTSTWIFFTRNPFMSQADKGYYSIFFAMIALGYIMAMRLKNVEQFFSTASLFIFTFILVSQFGLFLRSDLDKHFITNSIADISYFTLITPYCLASLTSKMQS